MVVAQEMGFNLGAEALSRIYHERGNDFERALDAVLAMQMTPQPQPVVALAADHGERRASVKPSFMPPAPPPIPRVLSAERQTLVEIAHALELGVSEDSLVILAQELYAFLKDMPTPLLRRGPALSNALRRYESFWLPLVAKHGADAVGAPPLDIDWVWRVHMLGPEAYRADCNKLFGKVPSQTLVS